MKRIKYTVKNMDIFGYMVSLNFNREGTMFKTVFGGFLSILYIILLILFTGLKINDLLSLTNKLE
jgi:hypothetical protein